MMTMNSVLMKFFQLPPAVRMMLALAGFGSLASIVFMLLPGLRTRQGQIWILIIGGIGLLLFLAIWGIRRMFFGKKSAALTDALESQGPTRGDIAEQEQIYRKKFHEKMAELKASGLSVYKLPWFVLMGEPGCGKTASLIHSGLNFPLGRDEVPGFGGTRNYNWWFTDDSVILDTAGRIAFQEEGTTDKVEWEYFLKLLKKNRARCPINGVIIALPADKMLRDSAEERMQKAGVLRDRLRQIHQSLGVRFPTFVLVTKMDLVGGFSEFFEEIRVDLQQRNQMVGWSRPGEFHEPYDPATFPSAFEQIYARLRDWSMRYLQRKATEDELGMVVTFPESFKLLGGPLHDYISTIFHKSPLIEPPFFRGFYFASAVQEGAPIFSVFAKARPGLAINERAPKAVEGKSFFIHDFYAKKVFPEHGLVFRSAQHVTLNRRMRRTVWIGSGAMVALMLLFFGFGISGTRSLIENPKKDCTAAAERIEAGGAGFTELESSVSLAASLAGHISNYDSPSAGWYARMLFIGANINVPREYVAQIHSSYVLKSILRPVFSETTARLAAARPEDLNDADSRLRFMEALRIATGWYGEAVGQHNLPRLDHQENRRRADDFERLLAYLAVDDKVRAGAKDQLSVALDGLSRDTRSFGREILAGAVTLDEAETTRQLVSAIEQVGQAWRPRIRIDSPQANQYVLYWSRFAERVGALRERYDQILALRQDLSGTGEAYSNAVERYRALVAGVDDLGQTGPEPNPGSLYESYRALVLFLQQTPPPTDKEGVIIRLGQVADGLEAEWRRDFEPVEKALRIGAPNEATRNVSDVYVALRAAQRGLREIVDNDLRQIRERMRIAVDAEPLDKLKAAGLLDIVEKQPGVPFDGQPAVQISPRAFGPDMVLRTYLQELRKLVTETDDIDAQLRDLRNWAGLLGGVSERVAGAPEIARWVEAVQRGERERDHPRDYYVKRGSRLEDRLFWLPEELFKLCQTMVSARSETQAEQLLVRMADVARETTRAAELRGLARLMPGYDTDGGLPFTRHRFNSEAPAPRPAARAEPSPQPQTPPEEDDPLGLGLGTPEPPPQREPAAQPSEDLGIGLEEKGVSNELLRKYHTRDLLVDTLRTLVGVQAALDGVSGGDSVKRALDEAAEAYITKYFDDWQRLVSTPTRLLDENTLDLLERARDGKLTWQSYKDALTARDAKFEPEFSTRLQSVLREAVLFNADLANSDVDRAVLTRLGQTLRSNEFVAAYATARTQLVRGGGEAAVSGPLISAWRAYVNALKSSTPPRARGLADAMVDQPIPTDFPLIAPLVDLARYGETLLAHNLATQLAGIFQQYAGQFPISPGPGEIGPDRLAELLKTALEFQASAGGLLDRMKDAERARETLARCEAWVNFLWGGPSRLNERPSPLDVEVAVLRVEDNPAAGIVNVSNVYNKLTVRLPLLAIDRVGAGVSQDFDLFMSTTTWDAGVQQKISGKLDVNTGGGPAELILSNPNESVRANNPPQQTRTLPGGRYSFLTLLGSGTSRELDGGLLWQYPVEFDVTEADGSRKRGAFILAFRLTDRSRAFPGLIPPFQSPGEAPRMAEAARYLK